MSVVGDVRSCGESRQGSRAQAAPQYGHPRQQSTPCRCVAGRSVAGTCACIHGVSALHRMLITSCLRTWGSYALPGGAQRVYTRHRVMQDDVAHVGYAGLLGVHAQPSPRITHSSLCVVVTPKKEETT